MVACLSDPHSVGRRKQAMVTLARGFAVDCGRIRTGQTTPQQLGLELAQPGKDP